MSRIQTTAIRVMIGLIITMVLAITATACAGDDTGGEQTTAGSPPAGQTHQEATGQPVTVTHPDDYPGWYVFCLQTQMLEEQLFSTRCFDPAVISGGLNIKVLKSVEICVAYETIEATDADRARLDCFTGVWLQQNEAENCIRLANDLTLTGVWAVNQAYRDFQNCLGTDSGMRMNLPNRHISWRYRQMTGG